MRIIREERATEARIRVLRYNHDGSDPSVVCEGRANFTDESLLSLRDTDLGIQFDVMLAQPWGPHEPKYRFALEVREADGDWYELGEFEDDGHIKPTLTI